MADLPEAEAEVEAEVAGNATCFIKFRLLHQVLCKMASKFFLIA